MPSTIQQIHREYGPRGLTVLAVNIEEDRATVARWVAEKKITFTVLLDPKGAANRGIRIGSAKDGSVKYFIPDPETRKRPDFSGTSAAEGVAADAAGNVYGAEVGPKAVKKYVKR